MKSYVNITLGLCFVLFSAMTTADESSADVYNEDGLLVQTIEADGRTVLLIYNENDQLVEKQYEDGRTESISE